MTLIELLVVMGVIGLLVSITLPTMSGYVQRVRLKAATRQVVGLVSLARSYAISSGADHVVVIDEERKELRVVNQASGETLEHVVHLPSSVSVALEQGGEPAAQAQFVFRPTGALEGRTVSLVLEDHDRRHTVTVMGTTGAVSVQ